MSGSPFSSLTRRLAWPAHAPAQTPLGAALLVVLLVASPACADDIPPQFMAQYEATRDYLQLLQQADADKAPAQLDSPRAMQLLAAVTNKTDVLAPDYATADLGLLTNACQYGVTLSTRLMQFGMGAMPAAVLLHSGEQARQGKHNAERFQAQLGLLLPYLLQCGARMQPLVDTWLTVATPAELAGLGPGGTDTLRSNAQRQYLEMLEVMRAQPAGSTLKRTLVHALAETAAPYAQMLQPAQRQPVRDALKEALEQVDPSDVPLLQQAIAGFSSDHCGTLCQS